MLELRKQRLDGSVQPGVRSGFAFCWENEFLPCFAEPRT